MSPPRSVFTAPSDDSELIIPLNRNLRQMFRYDIDPELISEGMIVLDDTLFIVHPMKSVFCSIHEDYVEPERKSAEDISRHLCHPEHFDRVKLLPNGREIAFPFDVVHICRFCRVTCNNIEKHFKSKHSCSKLPRDDGLHDLNSVTETDKAVNELLRICSPINEFPDPHMKDARYCSQLRESKASARRPCDCMLSSLEANDEKRRCLEHGDDEGV